jgi:hypothetical protein
MPNATLGQRFAVATGLGLLIWVVIFYAVLSWLQPLLFGSAGSSSSLVGRGGGSPRLRLDDAAGQPLGRFIP